MTINGWDIGNAKAKQVNVVWGYSAITAKSVWIAGSPMPALFAPQAGFKPLRVVLAVEGDGRNEIRDNVSTILSKLIKTANIVLDGFGHTFCGTLRSHTAEEISRKRWHKLTLELEGYECGQEVSVSGKTSIAMANPGTAETPVVITLTPAAGVSSAVLSIPASGWEATLKNLGSGVAVVIDGETGLVTEGNALKEITLTKIPSVPPGASAIACSSQLVNVAVTFRPRYL